MARTFREKIPVLRAKMEIHPREPESLSGFFAQNMWPVCIDQAEFTSIKVHAAQSDLDPFPLRLLNLFRDFKKLFVLDTWRISCPEARSFRFTYRVIWRISPGFPFRCSCGHFSTQLDLNRKFQFEEFLLEVRKVESLKSLLFINIGTKGEKFRKIIN